MEAKNSGDLAILKRDILSGGKKPKVYGKKGETVKIISKRDNVYIVEGRDRFPVGEGDLEW